jgi:hypothetical protein
MLYYDLIIPKFIWPHLLVLKITQLQDKVSKQARKARQRLALLSVYKARANRLYIFRQSTYIVYIFENDIQSYIQILQKKSYQRGKFSENSWNKRRSNCFQWCRLWRQRLYCYRFFLSLYMNQVPEMLY